MAEATNEAVEHIDGLVKAAADSQGTIRQNEASAKLSCYLSSLKPDELQHAIDVMESRRWWEDSPRIRNDQEVVRDSTGAITHLVFAVPASISSQRLATAVVADVNRGDCQAAERK